MKNPTKNVSGFFSRLRERWSEKSRQARIKTIRESFCIDERNDMVYILHNGIAVQGFPTYETVYAVMTELEKTRQTAVEYECGIDKIIEVEQL